MPSEPGKCNAKCLIQDSIDVWTENVFFYTGDNYLDENIEEYEIVSNPGKSEWVKIKSKRKCVSGDSEDCKIWSLVEKPMEIEIIMIVIDTSLTKEFVNMEIQQSEVIKQGGFTEWREVVCDDDITDKLVLAITSVLR